MWSQISSFSLLLMTFISLALCYWDGQKFVNSWPLHEVLSRVPDQVDIWPRCINMAHSKFDVLMFFTYHFINAKRPNFNKHSCQMAQRRRWDSLAAGLHVLLDLRSVSCTRLIWKAQMFCIIRHFGNSHPQQWQTLLNQVQGENRARKAGVARSTRLPGHNSLCKTRLWPNNDRLDCMNNYPDTRPKQHQTLQLESVKVKLFIVQLGYV